MGSEMCIRDSLETCALQLINFRPLSIIRKNLKTISCLLYTSDAADDMQCVDLGGRRIIKKYAVRSVGVEWVSAQ